MCAEPSGRRRAPLALMVPLCLSRSRLLKPASREAVCKGDDGREQSILRTWQPSALGLLSVTPEFSAPASVCQEGYLLCPPQDSPRPGQPGLLATVNSMALVASAPCLGHLGWPRSAMQMGQPKQQAFHAQGLGVGDRDSIGCQGDSVLLPVCRYPSRWVFTQQRWRERQKERREARDSSYKGTDPPSLSGNLKTPRSKSPGSGSQDAACGPWTDPDILL